MLLTFSLKRRNTAIMPLEFDNGMWPNVGVYTQVGCGFSLCDRCPKRPGQRGDVSCFTDLPPSTGISPPRDYQCSHGKVVETSKGSCKESSSFVPLIYR